MSRTQIQVPYTGMEHQSAVTDGNHFENGYYGRDWTGIGISPRFNLIIIHESGHEWFGNAVSATDPSGMWVHEGWTTYLESLYVEYRWGKPDALKYINGYKLKVRNLHPIIAQQGVNADPPSTSTICVSSTSKRPDPEWKRTLGLALVLPGRPRLQPWHHRLGKDAALAPGVRSRETWHHPASVPSPTPIR